MAFPQDPAVLTSRLLSRPGLGSDGRRSARLTRQAQRQTGVAGGIKVSCIANLLRQKNGHVPDGIRS